MFSILGCLSLMKYGQSQGKSFRSNSYIKFLFFQIIYEAGSLYFKGIRGQMWRVISIAERVRQGSFVCFSMMMSISQCVILEIFVSQKACLQLILLITQM